ncbi:hypothetical protein D7V80_09625 [Corallococcus sp. CA054B]|uniref:hypothetical protein n=1 Tax=Corallococcus sp. CA054B TaxID=2316734 RepID=UPI000EA29ED4|nr:hypothetical protein [Corallococcus sp. CA054B]RKG69189.1 hypothetical protein D7V80_09625 [Corallococcus sp. CA054B]
MRLRERALFIADAHLSVNRDRWRAHAMVMFGHLGNVAAVSARNARLSNLLNALRTPVADNALSAWGELGYAISPWMGWTATPASSAPSTR